LAEEGGVLDMVEEADLDGIVGEVREGDGLHGGGYVEKVCCGIDGRVVCSRVTSE
jgi:hypothetical protein